MFKQCIVSLLLMLFPVLAIASSPEDALAKVLSSFQSLSAQFSQKISDSKHHQIQESRGDFIVHRPSQFRWETISPNQQLIVANGNKLWIYDIDLEQVTLQPFTQTTGNSPARLLSGDMTLITQDFNIMVKKETPENISFHLTPKQKDNYFLWVELTFVKTQHYPEKVLSEMKMKDNIDQITHINFKNVIKNPKLKENLFDFTAPKGVDVINMEEGRQRQ